MENQSLNMKTISNRVRSNTPPFWKKVRKFSLIIGAAGGALVATVTSGGLALPAIVTTLAGYMVAVGATGAAVASAAVEKE